MNPILYQLPRASDAFHDVTAGSNGDYQTGSGWNSCTGLGTPNGQKLAAAAQGGLEQEQSPGVNILTSSYGHRGLRHAGWRQEKGQES